AGTITRTPLDPAAPNPANSTQLADASAAASPAIKPPSPTSLDGSGAAPQPSWFERNQGIVGPAISATGTGLLSMGQGDADIEAEERRDERIRENYGDVSAYTGLLRPDDVRGDGVVRPTPGEKYRYSFEVAWNPQTRRLEKIPLTTA
ncbi:MAG: hypothetical protein IT548_12160, partial [Alphaproteobacteria bacterium]|nr:hypothetical protein [Alphaproteobacteria bacterium]